MTQTKMILEDPSWYNIIPNERELNPTLIVGKWLCFGPKEELHLYLDLMNKLVEDSTFRAVKLARKDPATDPFPHKECAMCVFTSDDKEEVAHTKKRLIEIGLKPAVWKSDKETNADWEDTGKLHLEAEIVRRKRQLAVGKSEKVNDREIVSFDVFLCHNSSDKPLVRSVATQLKERGLSVWLDEWELVPGRPWQKRLEETIGVIASAAVLVGLDGLGPWQDLEMNAFILEFVRRAVPVIPVLLPGASAKPLLPIFLRQFTWVDLREGLFDDALDQLQWGITGKKPKNANTQRNKTVNPQRFVECIQQQQKQHVRESVGEKAHECFTDDDLSAFIRNRVVDGIVQDLDKDPAFDDIVGTVKKLPANEQLRLLESASITCKPTWAEIIFIGPAGQTKAGQTAERLIAEAICNLMKRRLR